MLFLKSSGIFPAVYMLLIRQYKVCLVSPSSACSKSAGILSTPYVFYFNSFNAFSNSAFVIVGSSSSAVISSSLSSSSSSSAPSYNSSMYCCHLSAFSSSSIRVFPSFVSIIASFNLGFPKNFLTRLYDFSIFPQLRWFSVSSQYCPSHSSLSFLTCLFIRFLIRLYSLFFYHVCVFFFFLLQLRFFSLIHGLLGSCCNFPNVFFAAVVIAYLKFSHC